MKIAKKRGLNGIAITDHDTIKGSVEAIKNKPEGLDVICGAEIKTDRGDVIGLFLTEEITASRSYGGHRADPCPGRRRHRTSPI